MREGKPTAEVENKPQAHSIAHFTASVPSANERIAAGKTLREKLPHKPTSGDRSIF
jgi:hypothetical protein